MRPHFPAMNEWVASSETASTSSLWGRKKKDPGCCSLFMFRWSEWLTLIFSIQSRIEAARTHTRGSDFTLRAHCSHFFCSVWLMQHQRTTLSSSELPAQAIKVTFCPFYFLKWRIFSTKHKHLHGQDLWEEQHSPAPSPDWHLCRLTQQPVYQSHLWRAGRSLQKLMSWRFGNAVSLFLVDQTAAKNKQTTKKKNQVNFVIQRQLWLWRQFKLESQNREGVGSHFYLHRCYKLADDFAKIVSGDHSPSRTTAQIAAPEVA